MTKYYQEHFETMPVEEIKKLQSEKLVAQVKHVYKNVEYYRNLMDKQNVKPEDIHGIEDLHKLPFLSKSDFTSNAINKCTRNVDGRNFASFSPLTIIVSLSTNILSGNIATWK